MIELAALLLVLAPVALAVMNTRRNRRREAEEQGREPPA
ncbi:hypothetical protein EV700_1125 [Fluviicoccus keumensis]|uniref:Uncharacterized protein n=1 Tax=Fluviicoccus keumensis TaxID=1435465 RepID=A0A4Q7Z9K2_9GAMM|nr:hypothetical protein EV700_1125 [Fluviicoccus keumensis]